MWGITNYRLLKAKPVKSCQVSHIWLRFLAWIKRWIILSLSKIRHSCPKSSRLCAVDISSFVYRRMEVKKDWEVREGKGGGEHKRCQGGALVMPKHCADIAATWSPLIRWWGSSQRRPEGSAEEPGGRKKNALGWKGWGESTAGLVHLRGIQQGVFKQLYKASRSGSGGNIEHKH